MEVDTRRRERYLEWHSSRPDRPARRVSLGECPAGPLALVNLLGVPVQAHLYGTDRQPGQPARGRLVEFLAACLNFELDAGAPQRLGELEEMRHDHRLPAA